MVGGSIADGVNNLTANTSLITSAATNQASQSRPADTFYREYGDESGGTTSASVSTNDLNDFEAALNSAPGQAAYHAYWDLLNGGTSSITNIDLSAIEARMKKTYTGFTATI